MLKSYYKLKWLSLLTKKRGKKEHFSVRLVSNLPRRKLVLAKRLLTPDYFRKVVYAFTLPLLARLSPVPFCSTAMENCTHSVADENAVKNQESHISFECSSWPWIWYLFLSFFVCTHVHVQFRCVSILRLYLFTLASCEHALRCRITSSASVDWRQLNFSCTLDLVVYTSSKILSCH